MRKVKFYKKLLIEVIETLITICMVLSRDSRGMYGNRYRNILESHINALGKFSVDMREKEYGKKNSV